jgi:hypothetical protein
VKLGEGGALRKSSLALIQNSLELTRIHGELIENSLTCAAPARQYPHCTAMLVLAAGLSWHRNPMDTSSGEDAMTNLPPLPALRRNVGGGGQVRHM